ncbi:hypothetical protein SAMN05877753_104417 [Bacillus oleivorans]|uniref:Uncharacterized protein n=1 Tax=Bacillus oleivorans TaxID=1448271 RepID=A0A285CV24_9BACI|nr:hypothetical protein SAMN05877753_104417 [Bacillus oleivorans]
MNLRFELLPDDRIETCRDLCNKLMAFQKSKSYMMKLGDGSFVSNNETKEPSPC